MENNAEFKRRLEYVGTIATMMKRTLNFLRQHGYCTQQDADSLCVSDDTAAWLCGRLPTCNFVSFRVHIDRFEHPNPALEYFKFEESLAQRQYVGPRYTYMNYTFFKNIVAIKLVVYTRTLQANMYADGLPYFVQNFSETSYKHVRVYVRKFDAIQLATLPLYEQIIEDTINELVADHVD
nr:late expression factor 12 [Bombyx mori nucleopolyhedrovirus]WRK23151.1 late expression factor 12 [Bombyx mori nucleopolyhedrovirus]WRK23289.1 late expression factor 12 [Bombyx mori nucleopolyhedrovirus]WRK23427.1 late expression factor 12 [Bombyx mori nucleopolyhedrovirus]WRK23565.1 late expression factor 12 [Bombyx mori nucleopolyhedrovirus]